MVHVRDGRRIEEGRALLERLGVTRIRLDRARTLGRLNPGPVDLSQLCGHWGNGRCAVSPTGDVWPCVMGRNLPAGNVRRQPLADVLAGPAWRDALAQVPARDVGEVCAPECTASDGGDCAPAQQVDGE